MPVGPQGQKRPRSVTANAVRVARISVGEADEQYVDDRPRERARKVVTRTAQMSARQKRAAKP